MVFKVPSNPNHSMILSLCEAPIIQGEMLSDLLHCLDTHKSMGPDGIHPRVLKELAEQSWLTEEVPVDWKLPNVIPIYKTG
ncbi:hypothetical protein QYF61_015428 [Mycteria americana]|uniref:Uncharacterized protein n=1 Tax=Mycteria americana TaxID=33587 RepID=A0AAN7S7H9_MYCAM|nr:hypothetical protein QYF61_015428 [Mycteria americana]